MNIELLLQQIFWYDSRGITVKEAAEECSKHERQVYYFVEGERRRDLEFLTRLSHYLVEKYSDMRLAALLVPAGFAIVPVTSKTNGSIDDELLAITEAEGEVLKAMRERNLTKVVQIAEQIMQQGASLKAEAEAMR